MMFTFGDNEQIGVEE